MLKKQDNLEKMLPKCSLEASKVSQESPKTSQDPPKMAPKRFQDAPSSTQDASKISPRRPKRLQERSRCLQVAPRASRDAPKTLIFGRLGKVWGGFPVPLTTCRQCESKFNSKFESKVPISTCQSLVLHGCPPRMTAVSA